MPKVSTRGGGRSRSVWLARAVVTDYHGLGGLDDKHLFLTVQEAGKSKSKVWASPAPDDTCLQTAIFSMLANLDKGTCGPSR